MHYVAVNISSYNPSLQKLNFEGIRFSSHTASTQSAMLPSTAYLIHSVMFVKSKHPLYSLGLKTHLLSHRLHLSFAFYLHIHYDLLTLLYVANSPGFRSITLSLCLLCFYLGLYVSVYHIIRNKNSLLSSLDTLLCSLFC